MNLAAKLAVLCVAAAAVGGCGRDEPALDNAQIAQTIENVAEAHEPEKKGPPAPALLELHADDLARELRLGAGCDFFQDGRLLFVSTSGDALAKINGTPVHLAASGPVGPTGGYFITVRFSISVGRVSEGGTTAGETTAWPARLTLTDRRAQENGELRLEGVWRCGA